MFVATAWHELTAVQGDHTELVTVLPEMLPARAKASLDAILRGARGWPNSRHHIPINRNVCAHLIRGDPIFLEIVNGALAYAHSRNRAASTLHENS